MVSSNFDKASKLDGEVVFWRSELKENCNAQLHTRGGSVIRCLSKDSRDSDLMRVEAKQAVGRLKRRAVETSEPTGTLLNSILREVPDCVLGVMPTPAAMNQRVWYARHGRGREDPAPKDLVDLRIPAEYTL